MRELYTFGERLKDGQAVVKGKDGKLYKTDTITIFKEPKRPALVMPKGTLKEVKKTRTKKQPENLSKDAGTFMTAKTQKAREDRQKLLQQTGQSDGMADIDYGTDNDDRQKLLRTQRPQVVLNGGFDPKIKTVNPGKLKPKKAGQNEEI